MAGAGRAALSLDAAALASNPASIAGLPYDTATVAAMPLELHYEYRGTGAAPARATNGEGTVVLPAAFAVHRNDDLIYGIGAYSYFGLSFDSGKAWGGQRTVEQAGLATFNIGPAVAWAVNDRLSVGGSVAAQWARPELRVAVANDAIFYGPPVGLSDGQLRLSGDSWAASVQLGTSFAPVANTRLGLAWTAPVRHSVPLDVNAQDIHPVLTNMLPTDGTAKLSFTLPQQLLMGISHQAGAGTLMAIGLSWQDWSELGEARVRLPGTAAPVFPSGLQDTWGASVGVRRALSDGWTASAGVNYESSAATDGGAPVYFPVAEQWKVAAGLERQIGTAARLRGALAVTLQGDADVVQANHPLPLPGIPEFTGTYTDTRLYLLSLAADFRL